MRIRDHPDQHSPSHCSRAGIWLKRVDRESTLNQSDRRSVQPNLSQPFAQSGAPLIPPFAPQPIMDVINLPVEKLIPYARNPRRNERAIATVAASLKEFGWRQPIVVDERMVILAGHTRLEAARQLGLTEVPVHIARGLTPAQARAYRLMDNRASENAEWDEAAARPRARRPAARGLRPGADRLRRRRAAAPAAPGRHRCPRRRGRHPRDAGAPGHDARRSLVARPAPAALRRRHGCRRRRGACSTVSRRC